MGKYNKKWKFSDYEPPEELSYGVRRIESILEEVAEEEGLSKSEINDLWRHQKSYIKKLIDREEVYTIQIPFIGALCHNTKIFDKFKKSRSRKGSLDKVEEKNNKIKEHENFGIYSNAHKRVPGIMRMARSILTRYESKIKKKRLMAQKKCISLIEEYSEGLMTKKEGTR